MPCGAGRLRQVIIVGQSEREDGAISQARNEPGRMGTPTVSAAGERGDERLAPAAKAPARPSRASLTRILPRPLSEHCPTRVCALAGLAHRPDRPISFHLTIGIGRLTPMAGGRTLTRQEVGARIASKAERDRRRAVGCEELAERTATPHVRNGYRRPAQAWLRLAALYGERQEPHRAYIDVPDLD